MSYKCPQFYTFNTWKGTGQEPDAGGDYTRSTCCEWRTWAAASRACRNQKAAVRAFPGRGIAFTQ